MTYDEVKSQLKAKPFRWLVTGAAGFIGSHLVEALLRLDQFVVGLDNFSTGYASNLDDIKANVGLKKWERLKFIEGDIRSLDTCNAACKDVDYILHQAALGSVPRSIENPLATNETNISGFLNILTSAKDNNVRRFVYAASSSTYGDNPSLPKKEEVIGKPLSPYAVTKYVNELYANVYASIYNIETIGLRYFNVFGPRQNPHGAYAAVIPTWISNLIEGKNVHIYGDGQTSRDFSYVENVIQANLLAATTENKAAINEVYNIALGQSTSLNDLYNMIANYISSHLKPEYRTARKGDIAHSKADINKAQELLGYEPTVILKDGLPATIDWYLATKLKAVA